VSVRLSRRALSVAAAERWLAPVPAGAMVVFAGRVRPDRRRGTTVTALDYEVDTVPALAQLRTIERRALRRFGAQRLVLWHRLGRVRVGEIAVITGASCRHRAEAFDAARFLIDRLKQTVPIWKEERARPARQPRRRPGRRGRRSAD